MKSSFFNPKVFIQASVIGTLLLILCGCQSNSLPDFERISEGMQVTRVTTSLYQHLAVTNVAQFSSKSIHVYIEGDGSPWVTRYRIARDPTPRYPLALALMRKDPLPSIYLGRPCYYNDLAALNTVDPTCNFLLWTSARYSEKVVSSMVLALRQLLLQRDYDQLTLIGYSGGGTIAWLMAQQMEEVDTLVTLAANLDVEAWTRYHQYSPLTQSLNPAHTTPVRPLLQYHFAGGKDSSVPPRPNQDFLAQTGNRLTIIEDFDHRCCWVENWPELINSVK